MRAKLIALAIAATAAGAHAQTIEGLLQRNAAEQARIERDVAAGRIDVHNGALLERRAGDVYRLQGELINGSEVHSAARARMHQAQNDLAGAIGWAERHAASPKGSALDRMHLRVESQRAADQQRLIAREFMQGTLTPAQVGTLETAQARIAARQSGALARHTESVAAAEAIQHRQNVQDYAIRRDPSVS